MKQTADQNIYLEQNLVRAEFRTSVAGKNRTVSARQVLIRVAPIHVFVLKAGADDVCQLIHRAATDKVTGEHIAGRMLVLADNIPNKRLALTRSARGAAYCRMSGSV